MVISKLVLEFLFMIGGAFLAVATAAFGYGTFVANNKLDNIENQLTKRLDDNHDEFERKVKKNINQNISRINKCEIRIDRIEKKINLSKEQEIDNIYDSSDSNYTDWTL